MNIRFLFVICTIYLCFSPVVKASDHIVSQGKRPAIIVYNFTKKDLFFSKNFNPLLNKVIIPTYPSNHTLFWKKIAFFFQKIRRVYTDLGLYLYASLFSIFR